MFVTAVALTLLSLSQPGLSWDKSNLPPSTVDINLDISNKVIAPDGFSRSAVLAGGTHPGTPIRATKGAQGARFRVNVVDNLNDPTMYRSTSIHWHGIFQKGTNWADGTAFITQCPITPQHSFLYDFTVASQVGTYWYHSHLSTQYCDGLRGAFVIYDPNDPYQNDYDIDDASTIITLADWYHEPAPTFNPVVPLVAKSTLINGRGRAINGTTGPAVPLAVVNVQQGKRYRFRLIAMSCDTSFVFSVDSHSLTVIEADGEYTEKLVVDSLEIFAGQRYSVILQADKPVSNYWIRANPARGFPGFDGGRNSAILRYAGAPNSDPTTAISLGNPLKEVNLHAKYDAEVPGGKCVGCADVNINFIEHLNFQTLFFEMNGVTFHPPTVPVLLQILSGQQNPQALLPAGSIYPLPRNKVIEITISGTSVAEGGPHPFHLHGHSFWVVRSGDSTTYNYKNPVRRDTVNTGLADGNMTLRFVTDNAGPWFLHCHIDWHLEGGLAIVFAEDIPNTKNDNPVPPAWDQLCPTYNATKPVEPGPPGPPGGN